MNVCLYVPYRNLNYAFNYVMILSKVVAHDSGKVRNWYDQFTIGGAIEKLLKTN